MAMEMELEERKGGKRTRWIAARHKYLVFGGCYFSFFLFPGCALVVFLFLFLVVLIRVGGEAGWSV